MDLDSWSLLLRDGEQEGVASRYTRESLWPCHLPLVAELAEVLLVANFWLAEATPVR